MRTEHWSIRITTGRRRVSELRLGVLEWSSTTVPLVYTMPNRTSYFPCIKPPTTIWVGTCTFNSGGFLRHKPYRMY